MHRFEDWVVIKEPTCKDVGWKTGVCSCGISNSVAIPTSEHTVESWQVEKYPTCTEEGLKAGICSVCGSRIEEAMEKAHYFEHIISSQEATCTEEGFVIVRCAWCEETVEQILPMEDHVFLSGECIYCHIVGSEQNQPTYPDIPLNDITYNGEAVTIKFVHTMGAFLREVLDKYIAKFNEIYPNITVLHTNGGSYDDVRDNTLSQLNVGAEPNIVYCYPDHVALYNMAGAVQTLDDFINSTTVVSRADGTSEIIGLTQEQIDAFVDGFYAEGAAYGDGKMYTLPFSKSTEVLYYNKEFFAEHNLTVPTTWEEMEDVCKKIKEIDPKSIPLGYDSEANLFITMCEQLGSDYTSASGEHYLFDNEENKAFVEMFRDWYQKGYMTTKALLGAYTSSLFTNIPSDENPVRSYMCIGSSGGAQHQRPAANTDGSYPFTVGIAPIPQVNPDAPKAISQGPNVTIFKKSNPSEVVASWLFVKYLTTNVDFQAEFSIKSGYMPVLETVAENELFKRYIANAENGNNYITSLSVKVSLEQVDAYFVPPAFVGSAYARDQVGALIMSILDMKGTTEEVKSKIDKKFMQAVELCECYYP